MGQLAGAVGNLAFYVIEGPPSDGGSVSASASATPGCRGPPAAKPAEFSLVLAMIAATMGRIGNEVVELQRPEIGELREPASPTGVSSITMPHKRNPEMSEHVVTLSRLVRASAAVMLEGVDQVHERDGRGWKAEWVAFPRSAFLTGAALSFGRRVLEGLEVDGDAMLRNLEASGLLRRRSACSAMSSTLGKHHAQERLQQLFADGRRSGLSLRRPCWPTTSSARGCPRGRRLSIEAGHRLGRGDGRRGAGPRGTSPRRRARSMDVTRLPRLRLAAFRHRSCEPSGRKRRSARPRSGSSATTSPG